MKRSLVISGTLHAVLLLWGLMAVAARPSEAPHADPLPVEFVSETQFSQLTAGVKTAQIDNAKSLADELGEPKPVEELAPKVVDKPEIKIDSSPTPEPKPEAKSQPKIAEKSQPKPEPKAEPKPAAKADNPEDMPKPDQIADESKKDAAKKTPKPEKKPREFKPDQVADAASTRKEIERQRAGREKEDPYPDRPVRSPVAALVAHAHLARVGVFHFDGVSHNSERNSVRGLRRSQNSAGHRFELDFDDAVPDREVYVLERVDDPVGGGQVLDGMREERRQHLASGGLSGPRTRSRILDYQAFLRLEAEQCGSAHIGFGIGLALGDHIGRNHPRRDGNATSHHAAPSQALGSGGHHRPVFLRQRLQDGFDAPQNLQSLVVSDFQVLDILRLLAGIEVRPKQAHRLDRASPPVD